MDDLYTRALARLDEIDARRTGHFVTDTSKLLRALLVERQLTTRMATGKEYAEAAASIDAALHEFVGDRHGTER